MYFDEKKKLNESLLSFFENQEDENEEDSFKKIIDQICQQNVQEKQEEFDHFLLLISNVSNNYYKKHSISKKIEKILLYFANEIKKFYSNMELFKIFFENKSIILILIKNNIITIDESIYKQFIIQLDFCHFFIPELKLISFAKDKVDKIERQLLENDSNIFNNFEEKRSKGENDSYICSLIREDSIEEFVSFVNRINLRLTSYIERSIFETNSFLINKDITIIEYAAFFGSIQIFQYLLLNQVELTPSLWYYVIHSNNAELIHLLEENQVKPPRNSYESCFEEAIKCHHNDVANYIKDNLLILKNSNDEINFNKKIVEFGFRYSNYLSIPDNFIQINNSFINLCKYGFNDVVNFLIEQKKNDFKKERFKYKIQILKFFYKQSIQEAVKKDQIDIIYYLFSNHDNISKGLFRKDKNIKTIAIPPSIKLIGKWSFQSTKLCQIVIPSSLTSIEERAFEGCSSLREIILPSSLTSIGIGAFKSCSSLRQISIPSSVTSIEDDSFNNCKSLMIIWIEIPSKIKYIGSNAFRECERLNNIFIPSSVEYIGNHAFYQCFKLNEVLFENQSSLKSIGNHSFCFCEKLAQIKIPSSVTHIENNAFNACISLNDVLFETPSSLELIGDDVFNECKLLTRLNIPSSVTTIGENAFPSNIQIET